jgi:hypothetical protein
MGGTLPGAADSLHGIIVTMSDGDQDWWRTPVEYGGMQPLSPLRMKELAAGVLGRPQLTSAGERDMARAVLWLLEEVAELRETRA